MTARKILLLTGEFGSGKTTLCQQVNSTWQARGLDVAGVLSLPLVEAGVKTGIVLESVRTHERRVLATRAEAGQGTSGLGWRFDSATLEFGAEILHSAAPCDVLVVDELGPLELIRGEGWAIALEVLDQGQYQVALVVVRPALVPNFRRVCNRAPIETLVVTRQEQQFQFERIMQAIHS